MDPQPTSTSDGSVLLWVLGALIFLLGAHVLLGWIRQAMDLHGLKRLRAAFIGSAAFGTALSVAIVLGLAGESLGFSFGYHTGGAFGMWVACVVLTFPLSLIPAARRDGGLTGGVGLLLALLVTAAQAGWITAVGFRPGINWQVGYLVAAAIVSAMGFGTALLLAFPRPEWARHYRYSWRLAGAGLMALSFMLGYSLVLGAAKLPQQVGSIYRGEVGGTMLAIVSGSVLPLVLAMLAADLEVRRRQRRREMRVRRRSSASEALNTMMFELQPEELEALNASLRAEQPPALAAPPQAQADEVLAIPETQQSPPWRPAT